MDNFKARSAESRLNEPDTYARNLRGATIGNAEAEYLFLLCAPAWPNQQAGAHSGRHHAGRGRVASGPRTGAVGQTSNCRPGTAPPSTSYTVNELSAGSLDGASSDRTIAPT
jgi:hypothetical protein